MAHKHIIVITSQGCGLCRKHIKELSKYIEVKEYDISQSLRLGIKVRGVPYSLLYEDNVLIKEWVGYDIQPIFNEVKRVKIKFKRDCWDRVTGDLYTKGQIVDLPTERAEEILSTGIADDYSTGKRTKDKD